MSLRFFNVLFLLFVSIYFCMGYEKQLAETYLSCVTHRSKQYLCFLASFNEPYFPQALDVHRANRHGSTEEMSP